ncbi:MAG TPA: pitrilysin family protein [bacterium]|nr:pitrilysin family protein [bacterium]HPM60377.1 pitrilysin family protein [bacterium]
MRKTMLFLLLLLATAGLQAQGYLDLQNQVVKHTLDNGLRLLILERHEAPVVSFVTYADVGAVNESEGITGISHIFEHMAFKGTRTIGTKDLEAELKAMAKEDETYCAWRAEFALGALADPAKLQELDQAHKAAVAEAKQYVVTNELGQAIEQAGGTGMNAGTSYDQTVYFYNLPSNKVELWMSLESDRFLNPVLREFYTEKEVIMEERRLTTDNQPIRKLLEEFLAAAYKAHPYGEPVIGHMSDIKTISRQDAIDYFKIHYTPANLVLAVVGDVKAAEVIRLAETYWGRLPKSPQRRPVFTAEPPQLGQKRIEVEDAMQPILLLGYHRPSVYHPDAAALNAISDVLGSGRTCRLYKSMVKEKKIAVAVAAIAGLTEKYDNLYLFLAVPAQGHTTAECETAILEELEKLKKEPLTAEELAAVKTRAKASFLEGLDSNSGLAQQLADAEVRYRDYREMFKQVPKIEAIQAADIQRVAEEIFTRRNSTVAVIVPPAKAD